LGRILADFRYSMQVPEELPATAAEPEPAPVVAPPREVGGPAGPEPTRFGDWERKGRCIDF